MSGDRESVEIRIDLYGIWRDLVGSPNLAAPISTGDTLRTLVTSLSATRREFHDWLINPETGELWNSFIVALNGVPVVRAADLDQPLRPSDRVAFLHPIQGGAGVDLRGLRDPAGLRSVRWSAQPDGGG